MKTLRTPLRFIATTAFLVMLTACSGAGEPDGSSPSSGTSQTSEPSSGSSASVGGGSSSSSGSNSNQENQSGGATDNTSSGSGSTPDENPPQTDSSGLSGPDSLPAGELPTVRLVSSAGGANVPFTVGQVFREGDVPTGNSISTTLSDFQAIVRTRWPDGSAKSAVLSGHTPLTQDTPLDLKLVKQATTGAPAQLVDLPQLQAKAPAASVSFSTIGTVQLADVLASPTKQTVSGQEMSEWIFFQPVGTDDHLSVWWRLRLYKSGALDIMVGVENGFLLKANPTKKDYTVTINANGTQRYQASLEHFHHTRWAKFFWYQNDPAVIPAHDGRYLTDTKLFPNYGWRDPSENALDNLLIPQSPFERGGYPAGMGAPGYSPSIGLLPLWDALYVTSGDSRAWRSMIGHALSYGRYGVHLRDETTNKPAVLIDHNRLGVHKSTGISSIGGNASYMPGSDQTGVPAYKMSHHPAPPYTAALLTGEWWFIEQIQFVSIANSLRSPGGARGKENGVFQTGIAHASRGAAWALRTLGMAATVTPDDDPMAAEFRRQWSENVRWYADRYVRGTIDSGSYVNSIGIVESYNANNSSPGKLGTAWWGAIWMQSFLQASVAWVWDMKLDANTQDHLAVRNFLYQATTGLIGDGQGSSWDYRRGGMYGMPLSTVNSQRPPTYFLHWNSMLLEYEYANNLVPISTFSDTKLRRHGSNGNEQLRSSDFVTGYWANHQPARAWAVDHLAPGASAGYARVIGAENYENTNFSSLHDVPIWGIVPRLQ